jgi:hypothetical protein
MASTLDLYIDTSSGQLIEGGSVVGGTLPTLTRNDTYTLRLRLLQKQANGSYDDIATTGSSLKVGIGTIEQEPSAGSFKLSINGTTSSAIAYNATAISVYNAISNNVSTVALYGAGDYGSYLLTATQPNTAMSFGSDAFTLFPTSSVLISTRRNPATSVQAQQVIKLVRNPIVYSDTFTATPTAGQIAITKLSDGSSTQNETYELTVGDLVRGGSFALVYGPNATTGIPLFTSAVSVQTAISSGISTVTANCSVQDNGKQGYIISFTGRLGLTNITTALTLDATGIQFTPLKQTTLTINTAEVEDAFADTSENSITPTIEIELTEGGTPKTIFQGTATIRKDLITAGSTVPGARDSYYTKSEANALFVENSTTNVDQTNRTLYDTFGAAAFDYNNRLLLTNSGFDVVINSTTGLSHQSSLLGFYNSALTAKPANINVVSGLINVGLFASSTTYGVLPGSAETLAALATIDYGTLTANTSSASNVTVTGATTGDTVLIGLPSVVSAGIIVQGVVFAANTVCMTAINATTASRTIGSAAYRITVIGY